MARAAQHSIVSHPQLCTSYTVLYASNGPKQAFSVCFIPILFLILVFIFLFFFSFSSLPLLPLSLCYTTTLLLLLPLPPTIISTADCHPPLSRSLSPTVGPHLFIFLLLHCYYDSLLPHSPYSSVYSFLFLHGLIPSRNTPREHQHSPSRSSRISPVYVWANNRRRPSPRLHLPSLPARPLRQSPRHLRRCYQRGKRLRPQKRI